MSVNIKFKTPLNLNIPTNYDIGLDDIHIREIPKMVLESNSNVNAATDSIIRIKEIPDIRAHMPIHMNFGFKILGFEIAALSMCGESQLITEKFVPNARERCEKDPCDRC